jgi:hypothetical protein
MNTWHEYLTGTCARLNVRLAETAADQTHAALSVARETDALQDTEWLPSAVFLTKQNE